MDIKKKNLILSIIVVIAIATIGVSFAYFVSKSEVGGSGSSVDVGTADLIEVTYDAGDSSLTLEDAIPGESASKNFTVAVTPTDEENSTQFAIVWNITSNDFTVCSATNQSETNSCSANAEELVWTLYENNSQIANGNITNGTTGEVTLFTKNTGTLSSSTTYSYRLTVEFKDTGSDQNHNMNKTLSGNIDVEYTS